MNKLDFTTIDREFDEEIKKRIAQIAGILNGSAVGDTGQATVAQQKLGDILELLPLAITKAVKEAEAMARKEVGEKMKKKIDKLEKLCKKLASLTGEEKEGK
mgnify:CR=1 FL=1